MTAQDREAAIASIVAEMEPDTSPASLLWDVERYLRRYVALTDEQAIAVVLWVAHVFAFEAASTTLYLHVSSAVPQSGKSRLLEVVEAILGNKSLSTMNISPAALYRMIDAEPGMAVLIDESDRLLAGAKERAEELYGLINSGSRRRGGSAVRMTGTGANLTPRRFRTFAPKAIAGLGALPDTVEDRSVPIRMRRRLPSEPIERFREADAQAASPLGVWLAEWATPDVIERLKDARPSVPEELNDRTMDAWEPLLAIADLAGDVWPTLARRAAVELHVNAGEVSEERLELLALRHVREAFAEHGWPESLPTTTILAALVARDDGPWAEWWGVAVQDGGKATLPPSRRLARLLAAFEVHPTTVRIGETTPRGYKREAFEDAWARNLPPVAVSTATTATTETPLTRDVADVADVADSTGSLFA